MRACGNGGPRRYDRPMADLAAGVRDRDDHRSGSSKSDESERPVGHRRVGVFGGTFDPPHIGHLVTAMRVMERLDLDVVLLVVANVPWQKTAHRRVSPAVDRLDMVTAAVADEPGLDVCDLEVRRGGVSYTIDTLEALRESGPDDDIVLVLGADAANGLHTWERWEELATMCRLAVVDRPGTSVAVPGGFTFDHVRVPLLDVSSTDLRQRVRQGLSIRFLVPEAVASLIEERRLYRVGHDDDGQ